MASTFLYRWPDQLRLEYSRMDQLTQKSLLQTWSDQWIFEPIELIWMMLMKSLDLPLDESCMNEFNDGKIGQFSISKTSTCCPRWAKPSTVPPPPPGWSPRVPSWPRRSTLWWGSQLRRYLNLAQFGCWFSLMLAPIRLIGVGGCQHVFISLVRLTALQSLF